MAFNIEKESINPHYRFLIRAMKRKAAEEAGGRPQNVLYY